LLVETSAASAAFAPSNSAARGQNETVRGRTPSDRGDARTRGAPPPGAALLVLLGYQAWQTNKMVNFCHEKERK
jgi:hypothetical protein